MHCLSKNDSSEETVDNAKRRENGKPYFILFNVNNYKSREQTRKFTRRPFTEERERVTGF
jgi:hypothetical protein